LNGWLVLIQFFIATYVHIRMSDSNQEELEDNRREADAVKKSGGRFGKYGEIKRLQRAWMRKRNDDPRFGKRACRKKRRK
jgi:hypothetical protein